MVTLLVMNETGHQQLLLETRDAKSAAKKHVDAGGRLVDAKTHELKKPGALKKGDEALLLEPIVGG